MTHDGTSQNVASQKGGKKLYMAVNIAHPEEKSHNSKLPFFRRRNLIIILFNSSIQN
jgi:hypothetical protein